MIYDIALKAMLVLIILTAIALNAFGQQILRIKISNIETSTGKVIVALFQDEANWLKNPYQEVTLSTEKALNTAEFDVLYGRYAVSIYQDLNSNGELDRNFLGIPKEPVGFGNNYKPFGNPKFKSALIEHSADVKPEEIKLFEVF